MQRVFRSRGIRLIKSEDGVSCKEKVYYEPDDSSAIKNSSVNNLQSDGVISLFEYAVTDEGIDAFNYHVNLTCDYSRIYEELPERIYKEVMALGTCLGNPFKNYTIGYKFCNAEITGRSFYYYPTVWKEKRYGIKGITDSRIIREKLNAFYKHIGINEDSFGDEKKDFIDSIYKLKGINVAYKLDRLDYKVYCRMETEQLKLLLKKYLGYELKEHSEYGPVVLVAQRIYNSAIVGYNIYYLN